MSKIEKQKQLGMNPSTASARLKKEIMFDMAKRLNEDVCFHCQKKIESVEEFSVEHKVPWLHSLHPKKLYFDLDNIAFSHLHCNVKASRLGRVKGGNSKYTGVTISRAPRLKKIKWQSSIKFEGKNKFLGHFDTEEEAAMAYNNFVINNNLPRELNVVDGQEVSGE